MSPPTALEAEPNFTDSGLSSSFSSSTASSTASLTSSIKSHIFTNGRRYHRNSSSDGSYALPSDEVEQDRLDMQHHLQLLMMGGRLCATEFEEGKRQNVLDIGTGTGIWALDFGESHPGAKVLGVDLTPIQPSWCSSPTSPPEPEPQLTKTPGSTYPNVTFQTDDPEI